MKGINWEKVKIIAKNEYFNDKGMVIVLVLSLALNILLWFYIKANIKSDAFSIALHYTIYFGIDLLGTANQALTIALVGLIIFITNLILGFKIYGYSRLASYFLGITSVLAQVFLFLAAYGLVLINR